MSLFLIDLKYERESAPACGHASMHFKQRLQSSFCIFPLPLTCNSFTPIGHTLKHLPQELHKFLFFLNCKKLNRSNILINAPTGQKKQNNRFLKNIAANVTPTRIQVIPLIINSEKFVKLIPKFKKFPSKIPRIDLTGHISQKNGGESTLNPNPKRIRNVKEEPRSNMYFIGLKKYRVFPESWFVFIPVFFTKPIPSCNVPKGQSQPHQNLLNRIMKIMILEKKSIYAKAPPDIRYPGVSIPLSREEYSVRPC